MDLIAGAGEARPRRGRELREVEPRGRRRSCDGRGRRARAGLVLRSPRVLKMTGDPRNLSFCCRDGSPSFALTSLLSLRRLSRVALNVRTALCDVRAAPSLNLFRGKKQVTVAAADRCGKSSFEGYVWKYHRLLLSRDPMAVAAASLEFRRSS